MPLTINCLISFDNLHFYKLRNNMRMDSYFIDHKTRSKKRVYLEMLDLTCDVMWIQVVQQKRATEIEDIQN